MSFKTTLMGTAVYQELNIFVASDKIYDIIFTSTSENGFSEEEKSGILNSFTILNDNSSAETGDSATSNSTLSLAWLELAVIIAIILLIISVVKKSKKVKQSAQTVENAKQEEIKEEKIETEQKEDINELNPPDEE